MDAEQAAKTAKALIEEYLRVGDVDDACQVMEEGDPSFVAAIVSRAMVVYVDCAKSAQQKQIADLFAAAGDSLKDASVEITQAVRKCEYLEVLTDTIVDCKNAPKWLGVVVGTLVSVGAVDMAALNEIVQDDIKINVDEMCSLPEDAQRVYDEFLASVVQLQPESQD